MAKKTNPFRYFDSSPEMIRLVVMMQHATKEGEHKLVAACTYPLTARGVVARVITELGVFDPKGGAFQVVELAPGVSLDSVRAKTGAPVA